MKLQDLIIDFLRENNLKLTERYLEEGRVRPKLIRFVNGNSKYSIVFKGDEPILHLFKERLHSKRPYKTVATVHGSSANLNYVQHKIDVDLNDKDSFKKILDFL